MNTLIETPTDERAATSPTRLVQDRGIATSFLKGLDLLTILARQSEGLDASLLARKLHLPRTSILRMLTTLEHYGLAAKNGRWWWATEQFYQWPLRDTNEELRNRYRGVLCAIATKVGELVELEVGEARGVRSIHWEQGSQHVTVDPSKRTMHPLHLTAAGKLILSQRADLAAGYTDPRLQAGIVQARVTGVAWNRRGLDPNIIAMATWAAASAGSAPIICIKWSCFRFTEARAAQALAVVRRELAHLDLHPTAFVERVGR